jgi:hypothetical protein
VEERAPRAILASEKWRQTCPHGVIFNLGADLPRTAVGCAFDQLQLEQARTIGTPASRLGLLRRDGTPKPVLAGGKFGPCDLPFQALPRGRWAVCMLTGQTPGVWLAAFILAKQAGFTWIQYSNQPLKPASCT